MPQVSVLMAAYNTERFIEEAVASVVAQTYRDWELLALDDGSTDSTCKHLESWAGRDSRIRVCRSESNRGLGPTRAELLDCASGEYAAVLDSDDIALPGWLDKRVRYLDAHPNVVVVSGSRILMDESSRQWGIRREGRPERVLRWMLLFGNPMNQPSCAFRLSAAREVGGYGSEPRIEDWSLFSRLCGVGEVAQLDEPLVAYRELSSSASRHVGWDRERLEPLATRIISGNTRRELGAELDPDLTWYLFRGRRPFRGDQSTCRRASAFVLRTYEAFADRYGKGAARVVAGAVLLDLANVLRCGGWSIPGVLRAVRSVAAVSGPRCLASRGFAVGIVRLIALPIRHKYARGRADADPAHGTHIPA